MKKIKAYVGYYEFELNQKGSVLIMDRKEWLIGELAKAKAKKDYNAIEDLATELYEVYGWCGEPYYTH